MNEGDTELKHLAMAAVLAVVIAFIVITTIPRVGMPFNLGKSPQQTAGNEEYNASPPTVARATVTSLSETAPIGYMLLFAVVLGLASFVVAKIILQH
jgi:hypothetical protein